MRVLVVEDDAMIGKAVRSGLAQAGMTPDWVQSPQDAKAWLESTAYDAVVLDLGLPSIGGLELLAASRAAGCAVPVLVVTARSGLVDRVAGLEAGADDYLAKPFDMAELVARLRAVARRRSAPASPVLQCGTLVIDPRQRTVVLNGEAIEVSTREFKVLQALMRRPGATLSRAALEQAVYGWDENRDSNVIEVHLHRLRKKLGSHVIKNIRGVGYKIVGGD